MMNSRTLALFDFDGTLTNSDSFIHFLIYCFGYFHFFIKIIKFTPLILKWKFNLTAGGKTKEKIFSSFFKEMPLQEFELKCNQFAKTKLNNIIKLKAINKLNWHKQNNHRVIIITASIENYIKPWSERNNIELIGTKVSIFNRTVTGKFKTPNCHGPEKVKRLKQYLSLKDFDIVYSYGDSRGDLQMFEIATFKYFKKFH